MAEAIRLVGSQDELAYWCKCSQQAISSALRSGRCSAKMAVRIEAVTRGRIKARDLCADLTFQHGA